MSVLGFHHVQLTYRQGGEHAVRQFYGQLLGLRETGSDAPDRLRFLVGQQRLELIPVAGSPAHTAPAQVAFEVVDLPVLRHRLLNAGCPLEETQALPGHRRFLVHDPAGHRLAFIEPEPSAIWTI